MAPKPKNTTTTDMTAPARITQADMERATKAVVASGMVRARIVMDLANAKIEIIVGEATESGAERNDFDED